ncbi:MAG: ATP-binding protein [Chloroflexota bacterium]
MQTNFFNRLWIRMAVTFSIVQIAFTLLPVTIFVILLRLDIISTPAFAGEFSEVFEGLDLTVEQQDAILGAIFREMRSDLPTDILQIIGLSAIVGTIAGFIISRRLVRPLHELQIGAEKIGRQELDHRIEEDNGTMEIQAVASAFNGMAEQLEKAEAVRKNLLADVAHELRTPLTVVQGNLQAMLEGVYPINEEEIAGLFDQTRHLTRLVEDLHELAQAEAHQLMLDMDQVNVAELVQNCSTAFRTIADDKQIDLRPELLGKLPNIQADKTRLKQAMNNLIHNAIRHTPAGGTVTVQAEQLDHQVELRVFDTGDGIEAQHLPHVFDRFYRIDESRQRFEDQTGSGLGLAIARAVVESHQGSISVHSAGLNQGSQFTIQLPLSDQLNK